MTQDEIIEMAVQAGMAKEIAEVNIDIVEAFAKLVAAKERETILKYANSDEFNRSKGENSPYAFELTKWIEERGQA